MRGCRRKTATGGDEKQRDRRNKPEGLHFGIFYPEYISSHHSTAWLRCDLATTGCGFVPCPYISVRRLGSREPQKHHRSPHCSGDEQQAVASNFVPDQLIIIRLATIHPICS